MRIINRSVKIIEATTPLDGLWESQILEKFLKMEEINTDFVQAPFGLFKGGFLNHLNQPTNRFVHICAHGTKTQLLVGCLKRAIREDDWSLAWGWMRGRVLTISACSIGRSVKLATNIISALSCDILIAPTVEIPFSDAAVFYLLFYYRLFSYRFRNSICESTGAANRLRRTRQAFWWARKRSGLGNSFRMYARRP